MVAGVVVTVGRVGRAHGVRGEVTVEVRTDMPEERFAEGVTLATQPVWAGPLTVRRARWHGGRLLVQFGGIDDRDAAEELRGTLLCTEIGSGEQPADPDEFFDHQLVGLRVVTVGGEEIGTIREVVHTPAQDLLIVRAAGHDVLVPFVSEIVPEVDVGDGRIVVDPPPGLLDLDQADAPSGQR